MLNYLKETEVEGLIVLYDDRLVRFSFSYIQEMCRVVHVKIIVLKGI